MTLKIKGHNCFHSHFLYFLLKIVLSYVLKRKNVTKKVKGKNTSTFIFSLKELDPEGLVTTTGRLARDNSHPN